MQWRLVPFCLALMGYLVVQTVPTEAASEYQIINTGIKGGGCWVDDTHFLVVKRVPRQGAQGSDLEGLYVLDPQHPAALKPVALAPLEPSAQKRVWQVTCQDGNITFLVPGSKRGSSRLYRVTLGEAPELIVDMRAPRVSLRGKYVLGNSHRAVMDGGPLQGVFEGNDDCLLADVKAGFKVLCWDWWLVVPEALPQFVFSKYLWEESVKIREPDGQAKWVPNSEPPLKRADGTEVKLGFFLRDLESRIVQEVPMKQDPYQVVDFQLDSRGMYLYGVCYKAGDHGDRHYTQGGRICRLLLDGNNRKWEEIVSIQKSPKDPFSLHELDVNAQGDVVMVERGHRLVASLWKYSAQSKQVDKLLQVSFPGEVGAPRVSPSGKWVSAIRNGELVFVEQKGSKP